MTSGSRPRHHYHVRYGMLKQSNVIKAVEPLGRGLLNMLRAGSPKALPQTVARAVPRPYPKVVQTTPVTPRSSAPGPTAGELAEVRYNHAYLDNARQTAAASGRRYSDDFTFMIPRSRQYSTTTTAPTPTLSPINNAGDQLQARMAREKALRDAERALRSNYGAPVGQVSRNPIDVNRTALDSERMAANQRFKARQKSPTNPQPQAAASTPLSARTKVDFSTPRQKITLRNGRAGVENRKAFYNIPIMQLLRRWFPKHNPAAAPTPDYMRQFAERIKVPLTPQFFGKAKEMAATRARNASNPWSTAASGRTPAEMENLAKNLAKMEGQAGPSRLGQFGRALMDRSLFTAGGMAAGGTIAAAPAYAMGNRDGGARTVTTMRQQLNEMPFWQRMLAGMGMTLAPDTTMNWALNRTSQNGSFLARPIARQAQKQWDATTPWKPPPVTS